MLPYSQKAEIIRLNHLEVEERSKFISSFQQFLTELFPNAINTRIQNSQFLMKLFSTLPDVYYTLVTVYFCRRRLGEQYTYISMYKEKHYEEEGVLLNKKTRLLFSVLEIVSRNVFLPIFSKTFNRQNSFEEKGRQDNVSSKAEWMRKLKRVLVLVLKMLVKHIGDAEQIISNVQWIILMIYMLDWNKHFTFIETITGIRYAYTFKSEQVSEISYAIEGYLLLLTFIFKALRAIYHTYQEIKSQTKNKPKQILSQKLINPSSSEHLAIKKEKTLCRICYDDIANKSSTKCGHVFCWDCIIQTLQISAECPVCRGTCYSREVVQLRNY